MGSSLKLCEPQILSAETCGLLAVEMKREESFLTGDLQDMVLMSEEFPSLVCSFKRSTLQTKEEYRDILGRKQRWALWRVRHWGKEGSEIYSVSSQRTSALSGSPTGSRSIGGIIIFQASPFLDLGVRGLTRRKADPLQSSTSCCLQAGLLAQVISRWQGRVSAISQRVSAVPGMQWCPEEPLAVMMMEYLSKWKTV